MVVSIIHRTSSGWSWDMKIIQVKISDKCPVCGGKRGTPYNHTFHEDGEWFSCDKWDNECGHIDKYSDVYIEAQRLRAAQQ